MEDRALLTTFTVTNTNDSGAGSLRDAVEQAQGLAGEDTIIFDAAIAGQTITLDRRIDVSSDLTIAGGSDVVTISGDSSTGLFNIFSADVTLDSITLRDGGTSAILVGDTGVLLISNSTLQNNAAGSRGGALFNGGGNVTVLNSTVFGNSAADNGGGLANFNSGTLTVVNSTIAGNRSDSDNSGTGFGGGVHTQNGSTTILRNTIVAGNFIGTGTTSNDVNNAVDSGSSFNLVGAAINTGLVSGTNGNQVGVDWTTVLLNDGTNPTLADNGGPTATVALTATSPAINNGSNALAVDADSNPLPNDQRGGPFSRFFDGDASGAATVDIGAFEYYGDLRVDTDTDVVDEDHGVNQFSLREAVAVANAQPGADTISFASGLGTITLTDGELRSTGGISINGPGASSLTISGGESSRIFRFDAGTTASVSDLTLADGNAGSAGGGAILTFADQLTVSGSVIADNETTGSGGGIDGDTSTGRIIIDSSTFRNNQGTTANSSDGGAIDNQGPLTITNSTFIDNIAGDQGGALWTSQDAEIIGSTFTGNEATGSGGALYNEGGTLTVDSSVFTGNGRLNVDGGAIHTEQGTTTVVTNSTFSDNVAQSGGAIFNDSADITVINSTLSGNTALAFGGGIWNLTGGAVQVTNSTIAFNRADSDGDGNGVGGAFSSFNSPADFDNTLVIGNVNGPVGSDTPDDITADFGSALNVAASSNNLVGHSGSAGGLSNGTNGNIVGATVANVLNPTLADNGGPTLTHALVAGSPAIDAGNNALAVDGDGDPLTNDQRGSAFGRFLEGNGGVDATVDIGAFEAPADVFAGPLVVDSTDDSIDGDLSAGQFTLREAIAAANLRTGADAITFDPSLTGGTITLGGSELDLTDEVTINGPGADQLTVDADGGSRVFRIAGADVTISDIAITGGDANMSTDNDPVWEGLGGGIFNEEGTLTVSAVRLYGNIAQFGGGINNWRGSVSIDGSTFDTNETVGGGAGLYNWGDGGTALATVTNSTFSGNTNGGDGTITNWAGGSGSATLDATNVTIAQNTGAGISLYDGPVTLNNSLVLGNSTGDLTRTPIEAASANNLIGDPASAGGLVHGTNGNILGDGAGTAIAVATVIDTTLADNGGPTRTHALASGSPAIDAGSNALAVDGDDTPLTTDQRGGGFARIADGTVDIGAFEIEVERFDLTGGVLTITTTEQADSVIAQKVGAELQVDAIFDGVPVQRFFTFDDVDGIFIDGLGGDDVLSMNNSITQSVTLLGGAGNDTLRTAAGDDSVNGGIGDDTLNTGDGNDTIVDMDGDNTIVAGKDDDTVTTGDGADFIKVNGGADVVDAGEGANKIRGGGGDDTITTGAGNDDISSGSQKDVISSGAGDDEVRGGNQGDLIMAGTGNDSIVAGRGADTVFGEEGDDEIQGNTGDDVLVGGVGNDLLGGNADSDISIGGAGVDTLNSGGFDDLLIGGTTNFDTDPAALDGLRLEWRASRSYAKRVANLRDGSGSASRFNGDNFLVANTTVLDDGSADQLKGGTSQDWFFARLGTGASADVFDDLEGDELVDELF